MRTPFGSTTYKGELAGEGVSRTSGDVEGEQLGGFQELAG
jgi:hypothetical protein